MAIDNINQNITPLTTFPDRTNYVSSSAYAAAVATWLSEEGVFSGELGDLVPKLETMIDQINTTADAITASEIITVGAANYKGDWSSLISYNQSDSVSYNGVRYISKVNSNLNNQPDVSSNEWFELPDSYSKAEVDALFTGVKPKITQLTLWSSTW